MSIDTNTTQPWQDVTLTAAERATSLLVDMTLREKVQQLGSTWPDAEGAGGDVAPMQDTLLRAEAFDEAVRDGIGQITRPFGTNPVTVREGREKLVRLQEQVVAANRFGIPAVAHEECLTGFTAWTATVFPTPLAWASTNDPELIREMAAAIGHDMRSLGIHQGLAPVLDVVRDYRWGRVEETLGEDPALVGEIATAYVQGLQSSGLIATLKHFAGYSASRGARNHAPVSMGPREFADVVLPPFARAVLEGRVGSVMNSYADVDGVPPAADEKLLTGILRDQWGFTGTVVSDYWAVPFLQSTHHVVETLGEAGVASLSAGMDVELPHTLGFGQNLLSAVAGGTLTEEIIDRAVLRVLAQKIELGLLDPGWTPEGDGVTTTNLDSLTNRDIAGRIAEESVILLSNRGDFLPVHAPTSIAVVGAGADDSGCLFGCYSFPNHVVAGHEGVDIGIDAPTILDAIRAEFPDADVHYEQGTPIIGDDFGGIPDAVRAAEAADLTVVVVGDRSGMFGHGTSGEGCDVVSLDLPGMQDELVRRVLDATDRVVLVVLSGRPYAIGEHADRADAALQVFFPGEEGGQAIAGVLSGRVDPSGRLPVQIPGRASSQPGTYLAAPLALKSDGVSNLDPTPAFPFGHGLSFSTLEIRAARADASDVATDGTVTVTATIANTGTRQAWHVPQLYMSDPVASVVRPVRQRLASTRVHLEPGATAEVAFTVHTDLLAFTGTDLRRVVEPGEIVFTVAQSAADTGREVAVRLSGPKRETTVERAWEVPALVTVK
ncbi:Periplasmic beta-glucosidase [Frondihabitans sp. 762G35]|uniref:beta-glucosidase family protein n=1 Tax=Frondihabitans sp. 762G35 TaxID=1446794 RepID=UPI000D200CCB|nr:glycoside hydrolase family 3 N-terminal domain-containing protein [Frondihabitans sp. 762G35]ARC56143.1 Periplasmic beta-glucosidase [Frondihabitans sp. 762G35]